MRAMVFDGSAPALREINVPDPVAGPGELLIDVHACGVCRTDLHLIDGELPEPKRPVIPGHEIVGTVAALGEGVSAFKLGDRVGVPWLGHTCGHCPFCASGRENLCDRPGSPATHSTAAMRNAWSPRAVIACTCLSGIRISTRRRCCARG